MSEFAVSFFHTLSNMIKVGLSYQGFWTGLTIIAVIGFAFYLFLRTPKV
jgi:hypothetical protein